jgi:hypothetical protein
MRANRITLPRWRGTKPLADRISKGRAALVARAGPAAHLVEPMAISARLSSFLPYDRARGYGQLKPALAALEKELTEHHGEHGTSCIGLAMLLELVASHEQRWSSAGLDAELKADFVDSMHRVLDAVERGGSKSTRMRHDNYCKELAICLHRLIPAGGQLIDPGSGIPRSLLLRGPLLSVPQKAVYMLAICRGFKPFAEFHTHERMRHLFTPEGWEYSFRRLPAVFRSYPELKGVLGASWFFDPKLKTISPNLSFVRQVSQRWGAIITCVGLHPDAIGSALAMSEHRRNLYAKGEYQPAIYCMIAAKSRILRHSQSLDHMSA